MNHKTGRNDPCPCGSGKKFKQCCLANEQALANTETPYAGAVERAVDWLMSKHRHAVMDAINEMLSDRLSHAEQKTLHSLDAETWHGIQLNATEWLIAEGSIYVKGKPQRVIDVLLGMGGPLFAVPQRQWLQQLSERPLRLYDVTDVIAGQQMTLCDALDHDAEPIIVMEKSGSNPELIGTQLAARIMATDGRHEMSGCAYPLSRISAASALGIMRDAQQNFGMEPDLPEFFSFVIRQKWLEQYVRPRQMPGIVDTQTGEPILLVTDHYRVRDWDALEQALAKKRDVDGDRTAGWVRTKKCEDGLTRPRTSINMGNGADKIELFHKNLAEADKGRKWFDKLAGESVEFAGRVLSDPIGMMQNLDPERAGRDSLMPTDIPADALDELIEQTIHRLYDNWADESIPDLGGLTPRQAIKTPAGIERVKGLLRSYEEGERRQAKAQGRREISYAFLWQSIGLDTKR